MMKKRDLPGQSRLPRRVMARTLAEDLRKINGGDGFPPTTIPAPSNPTVSEAATSESLPDHN